MKKYNWVRQAITVFSFLAGIMLLMNATPTIPVLAGEYDLQGSIDAAKRAEAELRQAAAENRKKAQQAEYDAIMIVAKAYVKAYAEKGYTVSVEQVWELAVQYYENEFSIKVRSENLKP